MRHALRLTLVAFALFFALCHLAFAQYYGMASGASHTPNPRVVDGHLVYRAAGSVTAPRPKYAPQPEDNENPKMKAQGSCILWLIVRTDGHPDDVKVMRSLGGARDEKAVEAMKKWRFEPAKKDGQPVAAEINVEMSFK